MDRYEAGLPDELTRAISHLDHAGRLIAVTHSGIVIWCRPTVDEESLTETLDWQGRQLTPPDHVEPVPLPSRYILKLTHTRWMGFKGTVKREAI